MSSALCAPWSRCRLRVDAAVRGDSAIRPDAAVPIAPMPAVGGADGEAAPRLAVVMVAVAAIGEAELERRRMSSISCSSDMSTPNKCLRTYMSMHMSVDFLVHLHARICLNTSWRNKI